MAEGLLCHKPCTVSGGGKSEISKSIAESILYRNFYIQDFDKDFDAAERILDKDFAKRFKAVSQGKGQDKAKLAREILSPMRSLGSVVRLLTPSAEYTLEFNRWLRKIPPHVRSLVFTIKRFYRPEWGEDIRSHFSVDVVDGRPGHELTYHHRPLVSSYLRVGTEDEGNWRVFRLRTDFVPAYKLQVEDDITASAVLPAGREPDPSANGNLKSGKPPGLCPPCPESTCRTASTACSSARTTPSIPASIPRPRAIWPRPTTSSPTTSRCPWKRPAA